MSASESSCCRVADLFILLFVTLWMIIIIWTDLFAANKNKHKIVIITAVVTFSPNAQNSMVNIAFDSQRYPIKSTKIRTYYVIQPKLPMTRMFRVVANLNASSYLVSVTITLILSAAAWLIFPNNICFYEKLVHSHSLDQITFRSFCYVWGKLKIPWNSKIEMSSRKRRNCHYVKSTKTDMMDDKCDWNFLRSPESKWWWSIWQWPRLSNIIQTRTNYFTQSSHSPIYVDWDGVREKSEKIHINELYAFNH